VATLAPADVRLKGSLHREVPKKRSLRATAKSIEEPLGPVRGSRTRLAPRSFPPLEIHKKKAHGPPDRVTSPQVWRDLWTAGKYLHIGSF